jgi:Asp-tRNA(Asn)/Glu-tRNA(Gln) amidotransferase A subunit family amidase
MYGAGQRVMFRLFPEIIHLHNEHNPSFYGQAPEPIHKNLTEFYKLNRSEGFGKEVQKRILLGTFVLSSGYYDAYFTKAQQVRKLLKDFCAHFKNS